jgi:hypothetical protein
VEDSAKLSESEAFPDERSQSIAFNLLLMSCKRKRRWSRHCVFILHLLIAKLSQTPNAVNPVAIDVDGALRFR